MEYSRLEAAAAVVLDVNAHDLIERVLGGKAQFARAARFDALRPPCYLEIKNVHLMRSPGLAEFPDAVTKRGAKHLGELAAVAANGGRAVMLFLIQIGSAQRFKLARDIDPAYATAFAAARRAGVEATAYRCRIAHEGIEVVARVPIEE